MAQTTSCDLPAQNHHVKESRMTKWQIPNLADYVGGQRLMFEPEGSIEMFSVDVVSKITLDNEGLVVTNSESYLRLPKGWVTGPAPEGVQTCRYCFSEWKWHPVVNGFVVERGDDRFVTQFLPRGFPALEQLRGVLAAGTWTKIQSLRAMY